MKKLIMASDIGANNPYEGAEKDLDLAIVDVTDSETPTRYGKATILSSAEFNEAYENGNEDAKALINSDSPVQESVTVKSTTQSQTVIPDTGKVFNSVTVSPIVLETATAELSTEEDTVITPAEGNDGLSQVTVPRVTAAIDANILAENIKSGVTILGVEGTYTGEPVEEPQL